MPKFGNIQFNSGYFGDSVHAAGFPYKAIHRIPLGMWIRKQFAKRIIFRVRTGNGYYGTEIGQKIQDKYKYVVPSSINNTQSDAIRSLFATAVGNWQTSLSESEKQEYNSKANNGMHMSGYNLYIREYINANK